ncbi:hypothetical protein EJB05_00318, partial [Eragrostis curvula]
METIAGLAPNLSDTDDLSPTNPPGDGEDLEDRPFGSNLDLPPKLRSKSRARVSVDAQGCFHFHGGIRIPGAPFRSLGEVLAAAEAELALMAGESEQGGEWSASSSEIFVKFYSRKVPLHREPAPWSHWEYNISLKAGLFYVHPTIVGGPFHSLGEATAAMKRHSTWASATQILTEGYYFTMKDGLFHLHPNDLGGPFDKLDKATDAIWRHHASLKAYEQEQARQEKIRIMDQFLDEVDLDMYETLEMLRCGERDTEPPEPVTRSLVDGFPSFWEHGRCDPAISELADRFEEIVAKKEAIKNGMKWMESEVLQAFETYKADYQGPKYEFVKLDKQCLIYDTFSNSYHHYNFTMKKKSSFYLRKRREKRSSKSWDYQQFFAEVKSTEKGKLFFCCPLQPGEKNGHCFGCRNVGIDLSHPRSGGYQVGNEDSGFPFDSDGSDE